MLNPRSPKVYWNWYPDQFSLGSKSLKATVLSVIRVLNFLASSRNTWPLAYCNEEFGTLQIWSGISDLSCRKIRSDRIRLTYLIVSETITKHAMEIVQSYTSMDSYSTIESQERVQKLLARYHGSIVFCSVDQRREFLAEKVPQTGTSDY